ncbi:GNAT family N-acetyltransferase [Dictyobacter alpinus]|nr:GNAT family N-acetyltransferase [Dictyobacter alpinus]
MSLFSAQDHNPDGVKMVRVSGEGDIATLEHIWGTSQDADEAAFRPRTGWWSLNAWATNSWLLLKNGTAIGVAAIHNIPDEDDVEARLALLPEFRQNTLALLLVDHVRLTVQTGSNIRLRIPTSSSAIWAKTALQKRNFILLRTGHMMSRAVPTSPLPLRKVEGITVRTLRKGEEATLLETLNRAWETTWNYHPIPMDALLSDLEGNRQGFFVAVDQTDDTRMMGTIHVLFNRDADNTDDQTSAWISNLTVDPTQRGKGTGRMLMTIALNYLHQQGATTVTLGVDGGAVAPVSLYRSMGFEPIRTFERWELDITTAQP